MYQKKFIKLILSQFFTEIYEDNFITFSLKAEVRLLLQLLKDSTLPSQYN